MTTFYQHLKTMDATDDFEGDFIRDCNGGSYMKNIRSKSDLKRFMGKQSTRACNEAKTASLAVWDRYEREND